EGGSQRYCLERERLEMLGQFERLRLVVGTEAGAVETVRQLGQTLVDQPADGLAVADEKRHLAASHLEHGAAAAAAGGGMAKAGIEEAGIMDAELADQRIEGHHLRGI